jgi:peptide/nickel transport system ATP-binding protein/oligopeptide transport system ATP-binding protein
LKQGEVMATKENVILTVKDLSLGFYSDRGIMPALDNVSFSIYEDEVVALVGESGCGKSTTAMSIMRLLQTPPAVYSSGTINFQGSELLTLPKEALRKIRGNKISMIFQEPMTSLNPVLTVGDQLGEVFKLHSNFSKKEIYKNSIDILQKVGISYEKERLKSYPSQLSGGMRQRVMIAMAISCAPLLLIADEPTTALDVTIQAQILELMKKIKQGSKMSILLITHDLGVVAEISQRVVVMYLGQIVESADTFELFANPVHPYTRGLLESLPKIGRKNKTLFAIPGMVPDPLHIPNGCRFNNRCAYATEQCMKKEPALKIVGTNHFSKCWLQGTS